jgi:hypothetical protein
MSQARLALQEARAHMRMQSFRPKIVLGKNTEANRGKAQPWIGKRNLPFLETFWGIDLPTRGQREKTSGL